MPEAQWRPMSKSIGSERRLPADSGGTVWDLHPLPCGRRATSVVGSKYSMSKWHEFGVKRADRRSDADEVVMSKRSTVTAREQPVADVDVGLRRAEGPRRDVHDRHGRTHRAGRSHRARHDARRAAGAFAKASSASVSMHTTCTRLHQRVPDRAPRRHPRSFSSTSSISDAPWLHNDPGALRLRSR